MLTLGLDCSSTVLGWALLGGPAAPLYGHHDLTGDIAARCEQAERFAMSLLGFHLPVLVTLESPVGRFASAVIPQARVSGAVLTVLGRRQALYKEIAPKEAKRALCEDGAATKQEMIAEAAARLRLPPPVKFKEVERKLYGKQKTRTLWGLDAAGAAVLSEDEADAYALALAGAAIRVQTMEAALHAIGAI